MIFLNVFLNGRDSKWPRHYRQPKITQDSFILNLINTEKDTLEIIYMPYYQRAILDFPKKHSGMLNSCNKDIFGIDFINNTVIPFDQFSYVF